MDLTREHLTKALKIAAVAHSGQTDANGEQYIGHVLRVIGQLKPLRAKVIAALHDVLEDSSITIEDLREQFPECVTSEVERLTHKPGQPRREYIRQVGDSIWATLVKLADLEDNTDPRRYPDPVSERAYTYRRLRLEEKERLLQHMGWKSLDQGNKLLLELTSQCGTEGCSYTNRE